MMRSGQRASRISLILLTLLAACGFPRPADLRGDNGDDFTMMLEASRIRIGDRASATVGVKLMRDGVTEPVVVTVAGLPAGVTADPLTVDADAGTLTLHSTAGATQGDAALTITAAGTTHAHEVSLSLLAMGPPGTLDLSFGSGGMLAMPRGGHGDAIVLQPDGKILISGVSVAAGSTKNFMVARYLPDGTVDSTFAGGMVLLEAALDVTTRASVAVQPDGKVVVASTFGQFSTLGVVVRLNADGSHDNGFGSGGEALFTLGTAQFTNLMAVAAQPDGSIVLAGDTDGQAFVARLTSAGMLDASFNTAGYTVVPDMGTNARFLAVALQADARIIAVGSGTSAGGATMTGFARFDRNGQLDSSFDGNGSLVANLFSGLNFIAHASIAFQQDGKIVAAGGSDDLNAGSGCVARLLGSNGSLDMAFGVKGSRQLLTTLSSFTAGMALQSDGKFVAVGGVLIDGAQNASALVARYSNNGQIDARFGNQGQVTPVAGSVSQFEAVTLDSDGRILATGFVAGAPDQILLSRFWP